jgi:16S rRNA processing protein RimM
MPNGRLKADRMEELVAIARVAKTRGLRGEAVADVLTDFPERFEGLGNVTAVLPTGERLELGIENFWFQKGRIILKFLGYDSIEAAETLRNAEICVPEAEAVELEEGEFFDWELVGCSVETADGQTIGEVREVMRTGGTEILVIGDGEREFLVPFAEAICTGVDIENKIIKIDPPDGLLEF